MGKFKQIALWGLPVLLLASCQSIDLDRDRSAEQRKQAMCGEVGTHDLPHCTSYRTGLQDDAIESIRRMENPPPTKEEIRSQVRDRVEQINAENNRPSPSDE